MRRLIVLGVLIAFVLWRDRKLTAQDRTHGYGAYAPLVPAADP